MSSFILGIAVWFIDFGGGGGGNIRFFILVDILIYFDLHAKTVNNPEMSKTSLKTHSFYSFYKTHSSFLIFFCFAFSCYLGVLLILTYQS